MSVTQCHRGLRSVEPTPDAPIAAPSEALYEAGINCGECTLWPIFLNFSCGVGLMGAVEVSLDRASAATFAPMEKCLDATYQWAKTEGHLV